MAIITQASQTEERKRKKVFRVKIFREKRIKMFDKARAIKYTDKAL